MRAGRGEDVNRRHPSRAAAAALLVCMMLPAPLPAQELPGERPPGEDLVARDSTIEADIFDHYFTGKELYEKGRFDEALQSFENIRSIAPEYVDIYTLIGKVEAARKNDLRAAYFLLIGSRLDPKGEENRTLLEKIRAGGKLVKAGDVEFTWKFDAPVDLPRLCHDLYGNARYDRHVLELNALDRIEEPGAYRIPIDFSEINALRSLRKFDGALLVDDLNQLKFKIVEEKEFEISAAEAPEEYLKLVGEYLAIGRAFRAVMALEEVVYHHPERGKSIDAALVARLLDEVNAYLKGDPKNARGHYFRGVMLFLRGDWTEAMSTFFIADGLGLDLKYRARKVKFVDLCRRRALEHEEAKARFEAEREIRARVKEAEAIADSTGPAVPVETATYEPPKGESAMSEDEIVYRCTVNRSQIAQAVDRYNQDNLVEMDETNFHFRPLISGGYLKGVPVCPVGGAYDLLPGAVATCSEHGK